jgi:hypothetical protein
MPKVRSSVASRKRRQRTLKAARGYFGNKSRLFRYAKDAVQHAGKYAYRDRRAKKRSFRQKTSFFGKYHKMSFPPVMNFRCFYRKFIDFNYVIWYNDYDGITMRYFGLFWAKRVKDGKFLWLGE